MKNFTAMVDSVIKEADIILMVIDARRISESVNKELEEKVLSQNKKFIYVVNKADLIKRPEYTSLPHAIYVSATQHVNTMKVLRKIMQIAKGKEVTVGVIGYPNTGKSTLINSMKGRHSAPTSPISGYTRALQKIRISSKVILIDTPGVIPFNEKYEKGKEIDYILIGAKDYSKVKDPEAAASDLIAALNGKVEDFFGVEKHEDSLDTLEQIALKKGMLKKKGVADLNRAGQEIIKLWQKGEIR